MDDKALHRHAREGEIMSRTFTPGYIVLSYLVSYVGAWTTLELLHRRTARGGLYNWQGSLGPGTRLASS